jgi:hypothetical protein
MLHCPEGFAWAVPLGSNPSKSLTVLPASAVPTTVKPPLTMKPSGGLLMTGAAGAHRRLLKGVYVNPQAACRAQDERFVVGCQVAGTLR